MNRQVKFLFAIILTGFVGCQRPASQTYSIDLTTPARPIVEGGLRLGGTAPDGGTIEVNNFYMSQNGRPFIPIMGEVHFSRIPSADWEEEILKTKAGGVNVICTYVFWSMHEPTEGHFRWSGNYDLRRFVELCRKHDMPVIVRIGPFCHGEMRNGAIPDWIYGREFQIRTNDAGYLSYVDKLYGAIADQLKGLYYKDGGNIIGIQLENELQHSAASWAFNYPGQPSEFTVADYDVDNTMVGVSVQSNDIANADSGERHMLTLKEIARSKGIVAPLYTATGWGMAAIMPNECVPVTSAYPYPFWTPGVTASPLYLFKDIQAEPDYSPVRYRAIDYPSFCAEMGAGIQMIYRRRPRVPADAAEGLMLRSLGSGANGIGYYMYHGGTTPKGAYGFMSEEAMGVPKMSYDFQAPIGEFGKTRESYKALRLLHHFINTFGDRLAPMRTFLPEGNELITPEDKSTLRYAVRQSDGSGFVFITNFQDHAEREVLEGVNLTLKLADREIRIPHEGTITIEKDVNIILPFNLDLSGVTLVSATAQLLTETVDNGVPHYIFFAPRGVAPEYVFDADGIASGEEPIRKTATGFDSTFEVTKVDGGKILVTTLSRDEAMNATEIAVDGGRALVIADADVMQEGRRLRLQKTASEVEIVTIPALELSGRCAVKTVAKEAHCSIFRATTPSVTVVPEITGESPRRKLVRLPDDAFSEGVSDLILSVDYTGDTAAAFLGGEMVTDHFYSGDRWNIGLKRFGKEMSERGMNLYFRAIYPEAEYLIDLPHEIDFSAGDVLEVRSMEIIPEYVFDLKIN